MVLVISSRLRKSRGSSEFQARSNFRNLRFHEGGWHGQIVLACVPGLFATTDDPREFLRTLIVNMRVAFEELPRRYVKMREFVAIG